MIQVVRWTGLSTHKRPNFAVQLAGVGPVGGPNKGKGWGLYAIEQLFFRIVRIIPIVNQLVTWWGRISFTSLLSSENVPSSASRLRIRLEAAL